MNAEPVPPASTSEARADWLHTQRHELVCRVELSAMYHARRERFLLNCERAAQAAAALSATAAFSRLVPDNSPYFSWIAMAVAVASILPLVFTWSARANEHAVLAGDHRRLLARIRAAGFELAEDRLVAFQAELAAIEASEKASLGALVLDCQNEMAVAQGHPEDVVRLAWWQKALMHVFDFTIAPVKRTDQAGAARTR